MDHKPLLRWSYPCPTVLDEIPLSGHVQIEASAGTGKTFTLEHLVVDRLVRTDAKLTEILVMTFTEPATAELKLRIRKLLTDVILNATQLETAIEAQSADLWTDTDGEYHWRFSDEVRRKLELTLFGFDEAPIFTIHGFCNRILREQAFFLGEPLLQERVDSETLLREVWRDYLSSPAAQAPEVTSVLTSWLDHKEESTLFSLLNDAFKGKYLQYGFKPFTHMHTCKDVLLSETTYTAFMADVERAAIRKTARESLKTEVSSLRRVLSLPLEKSELLEALSGIEWSRIIKPHGQGRTAEQIKYPEALSGASKQWYEAMVDTYHLTQMLDSEDYHAIHTLLPPLSAAMQLRKRRDFQFDYDDLLFRLHDVLVTQENKTLAAQLRDQYTFALIDEFQDTDQIQWQIIERIFLGEDGSQLILIGDPKQAIYRFRGAEIETYLDAARRLEDLVGTSPTEVFLDTNYRSSAGLIDGINQIFRQSDESPIFSGEIGYTTPVKCGRKNLALVHPDGAVEPPITLLPYRPVGRHSKVPAGPLRDHYVKTVTKEILHLLSEPLMLIQEEKGASTVVKPAHILVLVRTNAEAKTIEASLRSAHLPVAQAPSGSVFQSAEAYAVLDLLRAVLSPSSTNAWTRVLTGPFFSKAYTEASAADKVRPAALKIRLEQWQALANSGRLERVLNEAYRFTSLELRSALNEREDQTLLNLRAVLNYCAVEVQKRKLRLGQLIEWLESILAGIEPPPDPFSDAPPAPESSNSIRIMTFHKSKGLEAPIVFICGGFGGMRKQQICRSSCYGGKQVFLGNYLPKAVERDVARAEREEEQRLLYVALTRASVKLYLPYVDIDTPLKGMYHLLNLRLRTLNLANRLDSTRFDMSADRGEPLGPAVTSGNKPALPDADMILDAITPKHFTWADSETPITSYSKLKRHQKAVTEADRADNFMAAAPSTSTQLDPETANTLSPNVIEESTLSAQLSGGKQMGQVLHDCLELIDIQAHLGGTKTEFIASANARKIANKAATKHQTSTDETPIVLALVWDVLTTSFKLNGKEALPPLGQLTLVKEMEFLYPYPSGVDADRGYIRGFIDALFVHNGKYYWLDWKSDRLEDYQQNAISAHVQTHYGIQAQLYTLALTRLLRIQSQTDYDTRVGGLMYVYLRGVASDATESNQGLFFMRPNYEDLLVFESEWTARGLYEPPPLSIQQKGQTHDQ